MCGFGTCQPGAKWRGTKMNQRMVQAAFAPDGSALLLSEAQGGTRMVRASTLAEAEANPGW